MLRISAVLMMLLPPAHSLQIDYFDSKSEPLYSWVLVDDCAVKVLKARVKETCYIVKQINDYCHLDLSMEDCRGAK